MPYKNPEKKKEYYQKNKEKIRKQKRNWAMMNPDKIKSYGQKYYLKNREKIRKQHLEYYHRTKKQYKKRQQKLQEKNKKSWLRIIEKHYGSLSCSLCGYNRCFRNIDFHHRDPTEKEYKIGNLLLQKPTPERIKELEKCDILCNRCHGELHFGFE